MLLSPKTLREQNIFTPLSPISPLLLSNTKLYQPTYLTYKPYQPNPSLPTLLTPSFTYLQPTIQHISQLLNPLQTTLSYQYTSSLPAPTRPQCFMAAAGRAQSGDFTTTRLPPPLHTKTHLALLYFTLTSHKAFQKTGSVLNHHTYLTTIDKTHKY